MRVIALAIICMFASMASAQVIRDSVTIYFQQGKHKLDSTFHDNQKALDKLERSVLRLEKVEIVGVASPEGSVELNKRLSEKRAKALFNYLSRYGHLSDSLKSYRFIGRDWKGLLQLVRQDPKVPYQQESIRLLEDIVQKVENGVKTKYDLFWRLVSFKKGKPYRYMYYRLFPQLRSSRLTIWFKAIPKKVVPEPNLLTSAAPDLLNPSLNTLPNPFPEAEKDSICRYWSLKTNGLYDLLVVPNIGVEVYLGKNWSVAGNWMYAWWKHDAKHWYWRIYGADISVRKWFGQKATEKPLQGHHIGLYAQALTYDFATGGRGYMGGKPGGSIWDKATFAGGVEYGYSHPITRRLNLDFVIGVGYLQGEYYEYIPQGDCYVWQATKNRKWFGPTKAEVSLVWLLGTGNWNQGKGGSR